jgi:UDP-glucose 4-epimerase
LSLALLEAGYKVVVADNLYNSSPEALKRIELICGKVILVCEDTHLQGSEVNNAVNVGVSLEHLVEAVLLGDINRIA